LKRVCAQVPGRGFAAGGIIALSAVLATPVCFAEAHELPPVFGGPSIDPGPTPTGSTFPLSLVPQLSSRPSARVKVFLDFNGAPPTTWGGFQVPTTPAYDLDGDTTTFNQAELDGIREVWSRVSEKYSPFDVNVTTEDPGTYEFNQTVRVVVGGDSTWAGGVYGGYGYVGGFVGATSNTAWVFSKNLGKGLPKYVAEAAAHEAGHNFGLQHQSTYDAGGNKTDEYNRGSDASAPIMGFSYYAQRGLWWLGPATSALSKQDDLQIISANAFGYRVDDHGGDRAGATLLSAGNGVYIDAMGGVIEQITDEDYFRLNSPGGLLTVHADVAPLGPMLDLSLRLLDVEGNLLALADTTSLGELISMEVAPGDYFVAVASHGSYGDVGQYTISGAVVPEPGQITVSLVVGAALLGRRGRMKKDPGSKLPGHSTSL
jgi:hypothetical protein